VWSEHYVHPDFNFEQERLPYFFKTRDKLLIQRDYKAYADYPYFLFLQEYGSTDDILQVLKDSKVLEVRDAMKKIPSYENKFAEYSVWNWNRDPVKAYQDTPNFPNLVIKGRDKIQPARGC